MKIFLEKTIRQAGQALLKRFKKAHRIVNKTSSTDFATEADFISEKIIIEAIKKKFPGHKILSEESPHHDVDGVEDLWVIDPLDGTRNFSLGIPFFNIAVSYKKKGQTVLAMVFDPLHNELFWAQQGRGAYLNNKKIRVGRAQSLKNAIISYEFANFQKKTVQRVSRDFNNLNLKAGSWINNYRSVALILAYTACGRLDVSLSLDLALWDVDAGAFIAKQAGAEVEIFNAQYPKSHYSYRALVANPVLFKKLKKDYVKLNY